MKAATESQDSVLTYIRHYRWEHRFSPSVQEIADHFAVYPNAIQDHINLLVKKGLLMRTPRKARSLVPL